METIEERASEYAHTEWISEFTDIAKESYTKGATEQQSIDKEAMLKGFTTDELRAELKRRNAEEKAKKESILRCRMCRHWGAIDYWGNPGHYLERDTPRCCRFFHTKNGKYYRCHNASQLACEHFERKEE